MTDGDAHLAIRLRQHDAVCGTIAADTHEWTNDGGTSDLVIVATDDRLLGGDVRMSKKRQQRHRRIGAHGDCIVTSRCWQLGRHAPLRTSVVQEHRVEFEHELVAVADPQDAVARERAEHRELDTTAAGLMGEFRERLGGYRHHHPFLRLAEPDLPGGQARILERGEGDVDGGAGVFGHLADRR